MASHSPPILYYVKDEAVIPVAAFVKGKIAELQSSFPDRVTTSDRLVTFIGPLSVSIPTSKTMQIFGKCFAGGLVGLTLVLSVYNWLNNRPLPSTSAQGRTLKLEEKRTSQQNQRKTATISALAVGLLSGAATFYAMGYITRISQVVVTLFPPGTTFTMHWLRVPEVVLPPVV